MKVSGILDSNGNITILACSVLNQSLRSSQTHMASRSDGVLLSSLFAAIRMGEVVTAMEPIPSCDILSGLFIVARRITRLVAV